MAMANMNLIGVFGTNFGDIIIALILEMRSWRELPKRYNSRALVLVMILGAIS